MKLIVGLGNPGKEYVSTRHNIGFEIIDEIIKSKKINNKKKKFSGEYYQNDQLIFLKPSKYMNLSGEVVKDYVNYFKIKIEDIIVIHDDVDLEFGEIKLKEKSGSGGHNGIKNIIENLNSDQFKRLKIGISKNELIETSNYVLSKFTSREKEKLIEIKEKAIKIIEDYCKIEFKELMNKYN